MALSIATGAWYPGFFGPNKLVDESSSSSCGKQERKKKKSLVKSHQNSKTLLAHLHQAKGSSQAPETLEF